MTLFHFRKDFWNHLKLTHGEPRYICDICEHKCFTKTNLNNHMQKHKCEEHRCDQCDFVTHTARLLYYHNSNKHMEKSFKCDLCDHRARRAAELLEHVRQHHTMERPFKCDQCEMAFSSNKKLKKHKVSILYNNSHIPNIDAISGALFT